MSLLKVPDIWLVGDDQIEPLVSHVPPDSGCAVLASADKPVAMVTVLDAVHHIL